MRTAFALVACLCAGLLVRAQLVTQDPAYGIAISCADSAHKIGNFQQCIDCYEKAFAISGNSYVSRYKAAQCNAQAGDTAKAFEHLKVAIRQDFEYTCPRLQSDMELENLRQSANWRKIENYCALSFQQINQDLQRRLDSLYQEDQRYRVLIDSLERDLGHDHPRVASLYQKQAEIDERNLRIITTIILQHGYPGKHMVGRSRQFLAFIILQHANGDLMTILREHIAKAVQEQDLPGAALAITDDIIAHSQKKPQTYGTQIWFNERQNRWELWKVKDPETLAERRKAAGLEPIEAYLKRTGAVWDK